MQLHSGSNPLQNLSGGQRFDPAPRRSIKAPIFMLYSAGFDATWEIDIFGGAAAARSGEGRHRSGALADARWRSHAHRRDRGRLCHLARRSGAAGACLQQQQQKPAARHWSWSRPGRKPALSPSWMSTSSGTCWPPPVRRTAAHRRDGGDAPCHRRAAGSAARKRWTRN